MGMRQSDRSRQTGTSHRLFVGLSAAIVSAAVVLAGCHSPGRGPGADFALEPGDLLLQDADGGPLCDAIEAVTSGYEGAHLSHVGIVAGREHGAYVVIEAAAAGVNAVPLDRFLQRSLDRDRRPKVLVGRLKPSFRRLIPAAIRHANALRGKPYDKVFDIHNDAYYCSELVYCSFLAANDGKPVFELQPMTFIDPVSGVTFGAWKEYFQKLAVPIPEGQPGINPGGISRSSVLTIVHAYGSPAGWKPRTGTRPR